VKGTLCIHATVFIATIRNVRWKNYVDSCFTVAQFKAAYSIGIPPMLSRNEWTKYELGYIMLPTILKRPSNRPQNSRIKSSNEPKKISYKCTRYGQYGHHRSTYKNEVLSQNSEGGHHQVI
jgi:hypothetical protein